MLPLNKIICGDNSEVLRGFPDESIDMVLTSPPYDGLRTYGGHQFDFQKLARQLTRVLKQNGVIVWVVGDETKNGSESLTSFKQAIHFKDVCGLSMHDTMIWEKTKPLPQEQHPRYQPCFEYMFVLCKGAKPKTFNELREPSLRAGELARTRGHRRSDDSFCRDDVIECEVSQTRRRRAIWRIANVSDSKHPATFPRQLAIDHIHSWSNTGDVVLDPFVGSGTTAIAAIELCRSFIGVDIYEKYCRMSRDRLPVAVSGNLIESIFE